MSYFRFFPKDFYTFGTEEKPDFVQNFSIYVDIVDQAKENISFYSDYYIQDGERPDQISYKLYDTPNYHWTLFLMNNKLRQQGWPLKQKDVILKVKEEYPDRIITTRSPLFVGGESIFKVGDVVENFAEDKFAVITKRDVNKGYLKFNMTEGNEFLEDAIVRLQDSPENTIQINSIIDEWNSVKYYTDADGNIVSLSVDPETGGLQDPGSTVIPTTYLDYYLETNESLKQIKVIRPEAINEVLKLFKEALRS